MSVLDPGAVAHAGAAMADPRTIGVRDAVETDLAAIRAIYAVHVERGTGTFEERPPTLEEMTERFAAVRGSGLPFLVADEDGGVQGFAYASVFRPRSAYRFTVEDSVYVRPDAVGRGLGRRLLGGLIERCQGAGFRQMVAMIGDSENVPSIRVHESLGFERAGHLAAAGYKFGRWLDVVFMQRRLGDGDASHP